MGAGSAGSAILTPFASTADRTQVHGEETGCPTAGGTQSTHLSQQQTMIEALKSDDIVDKLGGRFKLTALIQRRLGEIIDGARPLVERNGRSDLELVIEEILQEKITLEIDPEQIEKMKGAPARKR